LLRRIEQEAVEATKKTQSFYHDEGQEPVSATGTVEKDRNNPGAEIWGVGKSKL
jgi:hypothetical protein